MPTSLLFAVHYFFCTCLPQELVVPEFLMYRPYTIDDTSKTSMYQNNNDQSSLLRICATLQRIKDLRDEFDDIEYPEDEDKRPDFMIEIMNILSGTYEKIIGATVTYYLMINLAGQNNLHETVAKIMTEDAIKILGILTQEYGYFLSSQTMSLRQKIWYCTCSWLLIMACKMAIDQIPQVTINNSPALDFSLDDAEKNTAKSSYVRDKFHKYE